MVTEDMAMSDTLRRTATCACLVPSMKCMACRGFKFHYTLDLSYWSSSRYVKAEFCISSQ